MVVLLTLSNLSFPSPHPILYLQALQRRVHRKGGVNMRRYASPFNGNRYVLNLNTGEIHDLDNENPNCQIDAIRPEHVVNCISLVDAQVRRGLLGLPIDGCYYCLPSLNKH